MDPSLDARSELQMQTLDSINRINNLSRFSGMGKTWDELLPLPIPDQGDGRVFLSPEFLGRTLLRRHGNLPVTSPKDRCELGNLRVTVI